MKVGDKVQVLGVHRPDGTPQQCTLTAWHPNPFATQRSGEWEYEREDGRGRAATIPADIFPWPEERPIV